jgi:Zn-dependent peptidase ImmA (M78 family)/transcriptional regulator with XRE-family HTH domain
MSRHEKFFNEIKGLSVEERLLALKKKFPQWKRWWIYFVSEDFSQIQRGCEKAIIMEEYDIAESLVFRGANIADAMREALNNKKFLGKKLRFMRKLNDMSLKALGDSINVSKMAVSNWENGVAQPTKENILKLCDVFNLEYDYFFKESVHPLSGPRFRKEFLGRYSNISDDSKLAGILEEDVKMRIEAVVENYLRYFSSSPEMVPRFSGHCVIDVKTEKEAFFLTEKVAAEMRNGLGYGTAPINNIISFAEKAGFVVHEMELPESVKAFQLFVESVPFIFVNSSASLLKKRFSIGHEMGHFMLDVKNGYIDDIQSGNDKPDLEDAQEALCHYFAGALIVPDVILFNKFNGLTASRESLITVEREYGISCLGLLYRLLKLRIIGWKKLRELEKKLQNPNEEPGEEGCPVFAHESIMFRNS